MGRTALCRMFSSVPDLCSLDVGDSAPGGTTKNIFRHCNVALGSKSGLWLQDWWQGGLWDGGGAVDEPLGMNTGLRGWSPSWKPAAGGQQQRALHEQVDGGLWPSAQWPMGKWPRRQRRRLCVGSEVPHPHTKADPAANTAEHPVCLQQRPQPHLLEGKEDATRGQAD